MAEFDPEQFLTNAMNEIQVGASPALMDAILAAEDLAARFASLGADLTATLVAIKLETDPERIKLLQDDLSYTLPARKAEILAAAKIRCSSDGQAALETALTVLEKAALIVAKSFIPGISALPGLSNVLPPGV